MIYTSPDALWIAVRRGREVTLLAGLERQDADRTSVVDDVPPQLGTIMLESDDADLAFVGSPSVLVVITHDSRPRVTLHLPPSLETAATMPLDVPMRLVAVTSGPRFAIAAPDLKRVLVVRVAGRALAAQVIDHETPIELAVGLDRNQLLFSVMRRLEVWDAVSARPLLRLQLQLPPPPRNVGAAQGHLWAARPGSDEIFLYRLSDGRPFRHHAGSPIEDVISHPGSPVLVLVTARGLVRLHCFAHSLALIDAVWQRGSYLAQLALGNDIFLLGLSETAGDPWRVPIGAVAVSGQRMIEDTARAPSEPRSAMLPKAPTGSRERPASGPTTSVPYPSSWREPLAAIGADLARRERSEPSVQLSVSRGDQPAGELLRARRERSEPSVQPSVSRGDQPAGELLRARGTNLELPVVGDNTELGELASRLALPDSARRALIALYSSYLVGEPALAIAHLAHVLGNWTEPLGQGELHALAMLRRSGGRVSLRAAVTDLLDGIDPRSVRLVGAVATTRPRGATRIARDGKSDHDLERELTERLGRIAVIEGSASAGILEARLLDTTAITLAPPRIRPSPWPRDAALIVVADDASPEWVTSLPSL